MATTITRGTSGVLTLEVSQFTGGPAVDLTGLTITITPAAGGPAVIGPTSIGINHPATGRYTYTWAVAAAQAVGAYLAVWQGTDPDSDLVTGSEDVSVVAAAAIAPGPRPAGVWYCTREDVKKALDVKETARNDAQVDRAIEAATRTVDGLTHRRFWPHAGTRYFDWPNPQGGRTWRLWLDDIEAVSIDALVAGGVTIPATDYLLEPVNSGPPYNRIEVDLSSSSAFAAGPTHQRAIAATGLWGGCPAAEAPAGALAEALDATETAVDVTDCAAIGVGHIIRADSERMIVTGKQMLDTGQNLGGNLTASTADVTVPVSTGSAYAVDEVILVDSERMLIVDIAGNNLTVKRAWDGTVLAAHTLGADIYAPRTLVVTRGALGTSAGTHDTAAALARHVVPGLVRNYALALALDTLLQERSGYAREVGSGDNTQEATGRGLRALRDDVYAAHGRKARQRAV